MELSELFNHTCIADVVDEYAHRVMTAGQDGRLLVKECVKEREFHVAIFTIAVVERFDIILWT